MQNVIINTSRGCYLNTNLSRRAVRRTNSFEAASLVNKWSLELEEKSVPCGLEVSESVKGMEYW